MDSHTTSTTLVTALATAAVTALAAALIGATTSTTTTSTTTDTTGTSTAATPAALTRPAGPAPARGGDVAWALDRLAELPTRDEDTGAHYRRDQWGDWTTGADGCSTREAVLVRDGADVVTGAGCRVRSGRWTSSYDNAAITRPAGVQIDHVVPVKEAMRSGARDWSSGQRAAFYTDQGNLLAVSTKANTSKGDRDPGRWRPPARESWCSYASVYVGIKHHYGLTVDTDERAALLAMLRTCPHAALYAPTSTTVATGGAA